MIEEITKRCQFSIDAVLLVMGSFKNPACNKSLKSLNVNADLSHVKGQKFAFAVLNGSS